ncbi:MAG: hypothetical protein NTX82_06860 [Candidatus Parcubacteria bacterium]|nr:hypothetical protein [Candidatus Parcubacteria bacterium]
MKKLAIKVSIALSSAGFILLIFFVIIKIFPINQLVKEAQAANTMSCSVTPYIIYPGDDITISAVVNFTASDVWAVIEGDDGVAQSHYSLTENNPTHYSRIYPVSSSATGQYDIGILATVAGTGEQIICNPPTGANWLKKTRSSMPWHSRNGHEVLSFQGYLWLLGGSANNYENDVWRSQDGENWDLITEDAPWAGRKSFGAAVFANKMWIFGGDAYTGSNTRVFYHDVWWSTNGKTWTQVANADWSVRGLFATTVYDGKIWISGGYNGTTVLNELWSTSDPASGWNQVSLSSGFGNLTIHQMVVYDDGAGEKLWILGGYNLSSPYSKNDVWQATTTAATTWTHLKFCQGGSNLGKLCTDNSGCPGSTCNYSAPWTARNDFTAVVYDYPADVPDLGNKILVMGGASITSTMLNDVWSYQPSQGWQQVIDPEDHYPSNSEPTTWTNWSARFRLKTVVHDPGTGSKVFMLGGYEVGYRMWNDVWTTADGATWDLIGDYYDGIFGKRWASSMVAFDGDGAGPDPEKLWFYGPGNDIWSSPDGVTWTMDPNPADWSSRWGHKTLLYNNKLWLIGGSKTGSGGGGIQCGGICSGGADNNKACTKGADCGASSTCVYAGLNDVWSTEDGINWDVTTPSSDYFYGRYLFASAVFDDGSGEKMWILGGDVSGKCAGGTYINEICRLDTDCPSSTCSKVCVAGSNIGTTCSSHSNCGTNGNCNFFALNDVLSSADGATWNLETSVGSWSTRFGHNALGYNGNLYVMGGFHTVTGEIVGSSVNDVWSSPDGSTWTQATSSAAWNPRYTFALVDFQDKMWVYGGNNGLYANIPGSRMDSNNVYWSIDGATWNTATSWAEWDGRDFFSYTVFQDRMWLMGGDSMGSSDYVIWASRYGDMTYFVMQPQSAQVNVNVQVEPEISLVLSDNSCNLGTLTTSDIQTCGYSATVATNAVSGYTGSIKQDQGFTNGTSVISPAIDYIYDTEAISAQYGEYGIGIDTTDTASYLPAYTGNCSSYTGHSADLPAKGLVDTADHIFATYNGPTDGVNQGVTNFCHGTRIKYDTTPGLYSHTITITVIGNF